MIPEFVPAIAAALVEEDWSVRTYGAGAMSALARKHDISRVVGNLARVLEAQDPLWLEARKHIVQALVVYARKSAANAGRVAREVRWEKVNMEAKEIRRLHSLVVTGGR